MTTATYAPAARRRIFYVIVALATAGVVVFGFAPTYYARSPALGPLPPVLAAHGLVFTVWLGLFLVQTVLVPAGRTDLHRRLGILTLGWAALMVVLGVAATLDTLQRGVAPPGGDVRRFAMLPLGDIAVFAGLVTWGALLRRRADWHKRLMTMATVSLITPAIARIPAVSAIGPPAFIALTGLAVAAVIAFDWIAHGRPHPASLWAGAIAALVRPLLFFTVAVSPPWLALMDLLRGA